MGRLPKRPNYIPQRDFSVSSGYRFVDKNPKMDLILRLIKEAIDSGSTRQQISESSGVTTTTLLNWELGRTKKPQDLTMEYVARACGPYTTSCIYNTHTGTVLLPNKK